MTAGAEIDSAEVPAPAHAKGPAPRADDKGAAHVRMLESIASPRDLKALTPDQLPALASEIRDVLIETVSRTSGHLGPNLGVVELTIALHRVFDSPSDRIVLDTGHQSYVHKLLTGRYPEFGTLRPVSPRSR